MERGGENEPKKEYRTPKLTRYGQIQKVTAAGTGSGNDPLDGMHRPGDPAK